MDEPINDTQDLLCPVVRGIFHNKLMLVINIVSKFDNFRYRVSTNRYIYNNDYFKV